MKIERFGIGRECSEEQFENKFKKQGYKEIISKDEKLKKEYTVEELRKLAKENNIKSYWNKKEQSLVDELQKIGILEV